MARSYKVYFVPNEDIKVYKLLPAESLAIITTRNGKMFFDDIIMLEKVEILNGFYDVVTTVSFKLGSDLMLGNLSEGNIFNYNGKEYKKAVFDIENVCSIRINDDIYNDSNKVIKYIKDHKEEWIPMRKTSKSEEFKAIEKDYVEFIALEDLCIYGVNICKFKTFRVKEYHLDDHNNILIDGDWYELGVSLSEVDKNPIDLISKNQATISRSIESLNSISVKMTYKGGYERTVVVLGRVGGDKIRVIQLDGDSQSDQRMGIKTFFIEHITIID